MNRTEKPIRWRRWLGAMMVAVGGAIVLAAPASADSPVTFARHDDRVDISLEGQPLATYVWQDAKILRPYLAHIRSPNGIQVTRNHPPREGVDAADHDTMHPGIWLAFGDISGADFWRNKGRVEHVEFVEPPTSERRGFAVKNRYVSDGATICEEVCRLSFARRDAGTLIVWDSQFSSPTDFAFGDQEEMGLGVRMATPLTVKNGGEMINSDGARNEKQVWGRQADWCDYRGTIEGQSLGLLIVPDPGNFRRSWFHARDYGVLVANPFGVKAFTKGPASKVTVPKGQSFRLRFAVLVHGQAKEATPLDLPQAAEDCLRQMSAMP